jgi:hypothetical protein
MYVFVAVCAQKDIRLTKQFDDLFNPQTFGYRYKTIQFYVQC